MGSSMTQIWLSQSVVTFSGLDMLLSLRTIFLWSAKTTLSGCSQSRLMGIYPASSQSKQI